MADVQVFTGPTLSFANMTLRFPLSPRVLAVSDRSIRLFTASWFGIAKPKALIAELGVEALTEPHRNALEWETTFSINGVPHWVNAASRRDLQRVFEASTALPTS